MFANPQHCLVIGTSGRGSASRTFMAKHPYQRESGLPIAPMGTCSTGGNRPMVLRSSRYVKVIAETPSRSLATLAHGALKAAKAAVREVSARPPALRARPTINANANPCILFLLRIRVVCSAPTWSPKLFYALEFRLLNRSYRTVLLLGIC